MVVVTTTGATLSITTDYLLRPVAPRGNIGHRRSLAIALCSGLILLLLSSLYLAAWALPQCLASSCCEAGLSSSFPAGSRSELGVWCWMLAPWGCVQSSPTFSSEFVLLLVPVLLAPTALSFCWWRLTPLPKHQSQSVESLSGKWIPSSTLGVQLTDRGARTEMSQPGFARSEQFLSCSRTSGHPRRSGQEPNLASSTPKWSQFCFTDAKLGGRQRQCYRKSRHSSTHVCGASTTSDGQRWSQMKVFPLAWHNFQECGPRRSPHKKTCTRFPS